ncbi:hypothetical protein BKA80DRAFT_54921 [Phyllosticta citrichinensis]
MQLKGMEFESFLLAAPSSSLFLHVHPLSFLCFLFPHLSVFRMHDARLPRKKVSSRAILLLLDFIFLPVLATVWDFHMPRHRDSVLEMPRAPLVSKVSFGSAICLRCVMYILRIYSHNSTLLL